MTKIDEETLTHMRGRQRPGTRWYAYQNQLLDSSNAGHIICFQVGEGCTHAAAPDKLPSGCTDLGISQAYAYTLLGEVDLLSGEVMEERRYTTSDGRVVPLALMISLEPEWAMARIREGELAAKNRDDLLAIIHRDGGHYQAKHGLDKALEDAPIAIAARVEQELARKFEELGHKLDKLHEWVDSYLGGEVRTTLLTRILTIQALIPRKSEDDEEDPLKSDAVRAYESSVAEAYAEDSE